MALPFLPPATLDSSFTVSRPSAADIDALAEVYYDSFMTDPGNTYWWSSDREAMFEWLRDRIRNKMADRNVRHFHVVDQSEREVVVAFARWDIPKGYEAHFGEWVGSDDALDVSRLVAEDGADPAAAKTMAVPRGSDPELCQGLFAVLSSASKKWDAESMLGLSLLCTSPRYHRRGAAKALLAPMLAIADAVGLRTYLEATPGGRPIYEKLGFRTVEVKEFDLDVLTGGKMKDCYKLSIMIREPQAS
ncbi:acyl-CoA N-acyltransferase [Xylaria sp. FL1777]|nr:acyl-CoA N-acyltransferase [Xylaria sp. FL1777]